MDAVAGLDLEAQQVAVEREEVVAVRNDDVVAIAHELAVDQAGTGRHDDAVIGGEDRAALVVRDVDSGMEVAITEAGRLEGLRAGAADKRDRSMLLRPDQRVPRGVAHVAVW